MLLLIARASIAETEMLKTVFSTPHTFLAQHTRAKTLTKILYFSGACGGGLARVRGAAASGAWGGSLGCVLRGAAALRAWGGSLRCVGRQPRVRGVAASGAWGGSLGCVGW